MSDRERQDEVLTTQQVIPTEVWDKDPGMIRGYMRRDLGIKLVDWLSENGPAVVSKVEELAVIAGQDDWYGGGIVGMTKVRMRMLLIPISPLETGEWWFLNGPLHDQLVKTDGGPYWRVPISGEPVKLYSEPGPDIPRMLVALYRRDRTIYRFEGYER